MDSYIKIFYLAPQYVRIITPCSNFYTFIEELSEKDKKTIADNLIITNFKIYD